MSASSFALTRVPPARGRVLTAADEVVGRPRQLCQLMVGVVLGTGFWAVVFTSLGGAGAFQGELGVAVRSWPTVLSITAAIVVTTGLLACLAPILRGLRIRPVEALRVDA